MIQNLNRSRHTNRIGRRPSKSGTTFKTSCLRRTSEGEKAKKNTKTTHWLKHINICMVIWFIHVFADKHGAPSLHR